MSLKLYNDRPKPTRASEFGEASDKLADGALLDDELVDEELGQTDVKIPQPYDESQFETLIVRGCGACCCVVLGVFVLSWIVHAIPVSTITDIPPFARSMIWMSIAHHTDAWQQMQGSVSPPPPAFGDGNGNFPDAL